MITPIGLPMFLKYPGIGFIRLEPHYRRQRPAGSSRKRGYIGDVYVFMLYFFYCYDIDALCQDKPE
jgi:hypothetical protein